MGDWFYSYNGKTQRFQIGETFEDGTNVYKFGGVSIHFDAEDNFLAIEIDDPEYS